MLPATSITELLAIRHPVLQAPMAGAATPQLAAAVSAAGGLGALGSAVLSPDELRREVEVFRARTDAPLHINFFCHAPAEATDELAERARDGIAPLYAERGLGEPPQPDPDETRFDDARLSAVLEIRPAVASFHFGLPAATAVDAIRGAGIRVIAAATTVAEAVRLRELGADAVIAQGAEAGGHRASFLVSGDDGPIGTLALVPQVVDAVDVPVIAAGGIADGRGLAAVLALGAGAAQIGTAFLACPESGIDPAHREAVLGTPAEATTITRAFSGRPARAVHNRVSKALAGEAVLPFPLQRSLTRPLADGDDPEQVLSMWLGQAAPLAAERPAGEVVEALIAGAERALAGLSPPA
ncbi:MAG: NAD(P)H-dependent flavin oxidoreductase [Solirubrobacterales bacterium]